MARLLVVVGATGSQGRAVINFFQSHEPTWKIRGLTRDPTSAAAIKLSSSGIQMVKADLDDTESLRSAFKGANYIYAYSDFGGITKGPRVMGKFMAGELNAPIGKESLRIESMHGRNIADAAATIPELERLIWSSNANATKWSKGKLTHAYNFDAKASVMEYMFGLEALRNKVSGIQLSIFVENFTQDMELFQLKKEGQTVTWSGRFPGDQKLPWVDVEKDLGGYVKVLIDCPAPVEVMGVSDWKSPNEWIKVWSDATNVDGRFVELPRDTTIEPSDDPSGFGLAVLQVAQFVVDFGYFGGDPAVLSPDDLEKKGFKLQLTPVEDYVSRADWSKIIG